jgi:hypothetical protein
MIFNMTLLLVLALVYMPSVFMEIGLSALCFQLNIDPSYKGVLFNGDRRVCFSFGFFRICKHRMNKTAFSDHLSFISISKISETLQIPAGIMKSVIQSKVNV